jgi:hypothetical protein
MMGGARSEAEPSRIRHKRLTTHLGRPHRLGADSMSVTGTRRRGRSGLAAGARDLPGAAGGLFGRQYAGQGRDPVQAPALDICLVLRPAAFAADLDQCGGDPGESGLADGGSRCAVHDDPCDVEAVRQGT